MNKTKIEWCTYTWNPIVGCKRGCPYCYARKIHQRFHPDIPFNEISNWDERLEQPLRVKKPSKIFVGSMSDIEYWSPAQMKSVLDIIKQCPQHTFLFLTKNGRVYYRYNFPVNCWLGQTVIKREDYVYQPEIKNIKFISFEPLLQEDIGKYYFKGADWFIIGGLTPKPQHSDACVKEILDQASYFGIPVFMKNNLKWPGKLIQEWPEPRG
jgi:protein gp37